MSCCAVCFASACPGTLSCDHCKKFVCVDCIVDASVAALTDGLCEVEASCPLCQAPINDTACEVACTSPRPSTQFMTGHMFSSQLVSLEGKRMSESRDNSKKRAGAPCASSFNCIFGRLFTHVACLQNALAA